MWPTERDPDPIRGCDFGNSLNVPGDNLRVLYSNKSAPTTPAPVRTLDRVTVAEADGTTGTGPLNTVRITLQPMERNPANLNGPTGMPSADRRVMRHPAGTAGLTGL